MVLDEYSWKGIMTCFMIAMSAVAMPKAIEHDHYVAILVWLLVFLDVIWN